MFFFFKQKTAYDMRSSDWSSDVCSSYLIHAAPRREILHRIAKGAGTGNRVGPFAAGAHTARRIGDPARSFRHDRCLHRVPCDDPRCATRFAGSTKTPLPLRERGLSAAMI